MTILHSSARLGHCLSLSQQCAVSFCYGTKTYRKYCDNFLEIWMKKPVWVPLKKKHLCWCCSSGPLNLGPGSSLLSFHSDQLSCINFVCVIQTKWDVPCKWFSAFQVKESSDKLCLTHIVCLRDCFPIGYVAERKKYMCQRSDSAQKKQHKLSPQGQKGKHLRQVFLADPSNFLFNILMYTFCLKNLKQSYEETLLLW